MQQILFETNNIKMFHKILIFPQFSSAPLKSLRLPWFEKHCFRTICTCTERPICHFSVLSVFGVRSLGHKHDFLSYKKHVTWIHFHKMNDGHTERHANVLSIESSTILEKSFKPTNFIVFFNWFNRFPLCDWLVVRNASLRGVTGFSGEWSPTPRRQRTLMKTVKIKRIQRNNWRSNIKTSSL